MSVRTDRFEYYGVREKGSSELVLSPKMAISLDVGTKLHVIGEVSFRFFTDYEKKKFDTKYMGSYVLDVKVEKTSDGITVSGLPPELPLDKFLDPSFKIKLFDMEDGFAPTIHVGAVTTHDVEVYAWATVTEIKEG